MPNHPWRPIQSNLTILESSGTRRSPKRKHSTQWQEACLRTRRNLMCRMSPSCAIFFQGQKCKFLGTTSMKWELPSSLKSLGCGSVVWIESRSGLMPAGWCYQPDLERAGFYLIGWKVNAPNTVGACGSMYIEQCPQQFVWPCCKTGARAVKELSSRH